MATAYGEGERPRLTHVHRYLALTGTVGNEDDHSRGNPPSNRPRPDTTLTSFAQLVTLKLGVQRAIISLVGRRLQYILAESTQDLELWNIGDSDRLWMNSYGHTAQRDILCTHAINTSTPEQGYACYCVLDLMEHSEFRNLSYVEEAPHLRFYASTPLVTREGYRIGCLSILDEHPRGEELAQSEIDFLGLMASNVMQYLDMQRESEEQKRVTTMSKGLAAFTEGRQRIPSEWKSLRSADTGTTRAHARQIDEHQNSEKYFAPSKDLAAPEASSSYDHHSPAPQRRSRRDSGVGLNRVSQSHAEVLARGSNLLRESLNVHVTVFFDTRTGAVQPASKDVPVSEEQVKAPAQLQQNKAINIPGADILSFSTEKCSTTSQTCTRSNEFGNLGINIVRRIIKKYPQGHLWSFDSTGSMISVEEAPLALDGNSSTESDSETDGSPRQKLSSAVEGDALTACFPGVRQVLYAPIIDPTTSHCICACFAVSFHEIPVFTTEIEVAFARAFLNNVAVEWDRVSVALSDRQKGDFLSSISHEFRSPLHGILASTELLSESELNSSQRGLCETIKSCGQTLLNTVSNILDYSKVNKLHHHLPETKQKQERARSGLRSNLPKINSGLENTPLVGLFSDVDVASIYEAVVTTVCAGNPLDERNTGIQKLRRKSDAAGIYDLYQTFETDSVQHQHVTVILDIAPGDWNFSCPPGAVQRVLMNLLGNSLKYTHAGHVRISLEIGPLVEQANKKEKWHYLTMVVSDTGIGISESFLRNKLYSPFSQESILAPGTGLGLSTVKKIMQNIGGEISIESEIDKGTEVSVTVPLKRAQPRSPKAGRPSPDPSPSLLRAQCANKTVSLYGPELGSTTLLGESLRLYIVQWFNMKVTTDFSHADFVIVDEDALERLISNFRDPPLPLRIVVLRSTPVTNKLLPARTEDVLKPFGPSRLATGLLNAWAYKPTATKPLTRSLSEGFISLPRKPSFSSKTSVSPGISEAAVSYGVIAKSPEKLSQQRSESKQESPKGPSPTAANPIDDRADKDRPSPVSQQSKTEATRPGQPHILCVDDNSINLNILQAYLQKLGYTNIRRAENGLEAAKISESHENGFDLIFMDLSMPVCDGFESTRRIRKFERLRNKAQGSVTPSLPAFIIALTGQVTNQDEERAFECGMDHFVTKPMSLSYLKKFLSDWETKRKGERC